MTRGIDYAWAHPDPAAIAAAGYVFACRYLSRDPSKNLTRAEADALASHGIWVVANWEYTATDMLRGYAGGVTDAQLAEAQAVAAGKPAGRPIYFSADWDVTPAQEPALLAYLSGADSVLGWSDVGEYGGYYPLKTALDAGATRWAWQSPAWSGAQWDTRATIRQTGTATIGGVQVDVNQAMVDDFGQWMPGRTPPTAPQPPTTPRDDDMILHYIQGSPEVWALSGSLYWHVADPGSLSSYQAAGVPKATISQGEHQDILDAVTALKSPAAPVSVDAAALGAAIAAGLKFPTVFSGTLT